MARGGKTENGERDERVEGKKERGGEWIKAEAGEIENIKERR